MNLQSLLDAINDRKVVSGLTHGIYRYPARFSPVFARAAIELFTKPSSATKWIFSSYLRSRYDATSNFFIEFF